MNPIVYVVLAAVLVVVCVLIVKAFKKGETPLPVEKPSGGLVDPVQPPLEEPQKPVLEEFMLYKTPVQFNPQSITVNDEPVISEVKPAKKRGAPKKKVEPVAKMSPKKVSKK